MDMLLKATLWCGVFLLLFNCSWCVYCSFCIGTWVDVLLSWHHCSQSVYLYHASSPVLPSPLSGWSICWQLMHTHEQPWEVPLGWVWGPAGRIDGYLQKLGMGWQSVSNAGKSFSILTPNWVTWSVRIASSPTPSFPSTAKRLHTAAGSRNLRLVLRD